MAKYRCPVCGATHRELPEACRMCGQAMGPDAIVGDFGGAREVVEKKKGMGGIILIAALAVVGLVVGLALLGVGPGRQQIQQAANKVNLPNSRVDGWAELMEEGRFVTDFPVKRENKNEVEVVGTTQKGSHWISNLSNDTIIRIQWAKLDPADRPAPPVTGETPASGGTTTSTLDPRTRVRLFADQVIEKSLKPAGAKIDKKDTLDYVTGPAVYIEARRYLDPAVPDKEFNLRMIVFTRGDDVYALSSSSIYKSNIDTSFDSLLQSFSAI